MRLRVREQTGEGKIINDIRDRPRKHLQAIPLCRERKPVARLKTEELNTLQAKSNELRKLKMGSTEQRHGEQKERSGTQRRKECGTSHPSIIQSTRISLGRKILSI